MGVFRRCQGQLEDEYGAGDVSAAAAIDNKAANFAEGVAAHVKYCVSLRLVVVVFRRHTKQPSGDKGEVFIFNAIVVVDWFIVVGEVVQLCLIFRLYVAIVS